MSKKLYKRCLDWSCAVTYPMPRMPNLYRELKLYRTQGTLTFVRPKEICNIFLILSTEIIILLVICQNLNLLFSSPHRTLNPHLFAHSLLQIFRFVLRLPQIYFSRGNYWANLLAVIMEGPNRITIWPNILVFSLLGFLPVSKTEWMNDSQF